MKNDQTPQQPITQSRQCGAQTTPAYLHWCRADPPSSWAAHGAGHRGNPPKRGYISAIFAGVFLISAHPKPFCIYQYMCVGGSYPDSVASVEVGCWLPRVRIGIRTAQHSMTSLEDPSCSPPPRAMPYDVSVWLRPLPRAGDPGQSPTNFLCFV